MALLRRVIGLGLLIGLLVGSVMLRDANDQLVDIDYVGGILTNVPLWVVIVTSVAAGALLMALALTTRIARGSLAQRRYRKTVAGLEAEVHQLRNLPLGDAPGDGAPAQSPALPASTAPSPSGKPTPPEGDA